MSLKPTLEQPYAVDMIKELLERIDDEYVGNDFTVSAGETYSVSGGERKFAVDPVQVAGTMQVSGTMQAASGDWSWSNDPPVIRYLWEDAPNERGPGDGQPPVIYVWSPTNTNVERFSADANTNENASSVEIVIFTLEGSDGGLINKQYQRDVVKILGEYANDNGQTSEFTDTRVTAKDDRRNEYLTRNTNHHVTTVEVDPRGLFSATN